MKFLAQILAIVFTTTWLYLPLTKYFFFQDDFILFDMANRMTKWQDAFQASQTIFWRPLALGYFWLGQRLFGLDPYKFHLVSLGTHIVNALLVWVLVSKIVHFKRTVFSVPKGQSLSGPKLMKGSDPKDTKDRILPGDIGWLAGLLFGTSAIHFMSQVWIGEYPIILGLTFWLLTLLVGWSWTQRPSWLKATFVTLLYSFGLLTHELTVLAPVVIIGFIGYCYGIRNVGRLLRRHVFQTLFLLIPGSFYLLLRLVVSPVNIAGNYDPIGLKDSMKAIWWYVVWLANVPEELKYQSFIPFSIRPEFAVDFPVLSKLWRMQLVLIPFIGLVLPWFFLKRIEKKSMIHIATISFVLSLAGGIILFVALGHQYPFLLSFSLVGVVMLLASLLGSLISHRFGSVIIGGFLLLWIFSSWAALRFSEKSHWTVQEALMAQRIVQAAKDQFGSFPQGSTIIVPLGIDGKHKAAMADQIGMRVMFKEQSLTTYFGTLQGIQPPECVEVADLAACLLEHRIYRIKV